MKNSFGKMIKLNSKKFWLLFFFSTLFLQINASNVRLMSGTGSCKYTLNDGNSVDFSHLRRSQDYIFQVGRYIYRANFCAPLNFKCHESQTPAAIFISSNICVSKILTDWKPSTLEYIDNNIKSKGVKLVFSGGDRCYLGSSNYEMSYVMKCDVNKEIEFETIYKLQSCKYEYHFNTKYACPNNFSSSHTLFNSKAILFYLIILFSVYCVGFSYKNYRENPEDGVLKAFPHREFWSDFFENARIGVKIIVRSIKNRLNGNKISDYDEY